MRSKHSQPIFPLMKNVVRHKSMIKSICWVFHATVISIRQDFNKSNFERNYMHLMLLSYQLPPLCYSFSRFQSLCQANWYHYTISSLRIWNKIHQELPLAPYMGFWACSTHQMMVCRITNSADQISLEVLFIYLHNSGWHMMNVTAIRQHELNRQDLQWA